MAPKKKTTKKKSDAPKKKSGWAARKSLEQRQQECRDRQMKHTEDNRGRQERREKFVNEYMKDFNGTQSILRAGLTQDAAYAAKLASYMLNDSVTQALISERRNRAMKAANLTVDRILEELMCMGFFNIRDVVSVTPDGGAYFDFSKIEGDPEKWRALTGLQSDIYMDKTWSEGEVTFDRVKQNKIKLDKFGALELLGKYMKMWTDKHEVTGAMNVGFFDDILADDPPKPAREGGARASEGPTSTAPQS